MNKFCGELSLTKLCSRYRTQVLVLVLFVALTTSEQCVKISPCKCQFRNSSVINLENLAARGKARFQNVTSGDPNDHSKYYYNPCFDFKLPESPEVAATSCDGVAACEVTNQSYFSLGNQQSAEFRWEPIFKNVFLIYFSSTTKDFIKAAKIDLICKTDPHQEDTLTVTGKTRKNNSETVEMKLTSRCACADSCEHRHLSAGSVLIILFSVFVILYLLFGMIYNKLSRGAQGWELIPNYEFWQDFPLLVRDGCVYVAGGCKPDTTYERI